MEREIRITIELDLTDGLLPEELDGGLTPSAELELAIAAELEDLGVGEVEGGEGSESYWVTTAYTTHAHWNAAYTVVHEALRQRDLLRSAVIRKTVLGPASNGHHDTVVWPIVRS